MSFSGKVAGPVGQVHDCIVGMSQLYRNLLDDQAQRHNQIDEKLLHFVESGNARTIHPGKEPRGAERREHRAAAKPAAGSSGQEGCGKGEWRIRRAEDTK